MCDKARILQDRLNELQYGIHSAYMRLWGEDADPSLPINGMLSRLVSAADFDKWRGRANSLKGILAVERDVLDNLKREYDATKAKLTQERDSIKTEKARLREAIVKAFDALHKEIQCRGTSNFIKQALDELGTALTPTTAPQDGQSNTSHRLKEQFDKSEERLLRDRQKDAEEWLGVQPTQDRQEGGQ